MKKSLRLPENPNNTLKALLSGIGLLLFILTCNYVNRRPSCDQSHIDFTNSDYHIIITKKPKGNQRKYRITGIHKETGWEFEKTFYELYDYDKYLNIGDTIVKIKGMNYFVICKENYRIYQLSYCKNEKEYTNRFIDSFYKYKLNEMPTIDSALSVKNIY